MISFEDVHPDVVRVLKQNLIREEDLFHHYSDLYVGCDNMEVANRIINSGQWKAMAGTFRPLDGSDMDHYDVAVEIPFACNVHQMSYNSY